MTNGTNLDDHGGDDYFISHIHYIHNHRIRDENSVALKARTFYIHHVSYSYHNARTSRDIVSSKEQLKHLIERVMGGVVVANQSLAKYVICDDKDAVPKPKPLKNGQCMIRIEYLFNKVSSYIYICAHLLAICKGTINQACITVNR